MDEEQFKQITEESFQFLNNKGIGFICYMWTRDGELSGGCRSIDADIGDVMVAISRMVERFNIVPERLFMALTKARREMEEN